VTRSCPSSTTSQTSTRMINNAFEDYPSAWCLDSEYRPGPGNGVTPVFIAGVDDASGRACRCGTDAARNGAVWVPSPMRCTGLQLRHADASYTWR